MAFKDFLKVFVEEEQPKSTVEKTSDATPIQTQTSGSQFTVIPTAGEDPGMIKKLQETLIERKLPGPDYLELLSTAKALEQFIPDETQRFSAALGQLKLKYGDGINMTTIINTCSEYLGILESEKVSGLESCQVRRQEVVDPKKKELENLANEAKEIDQKINDLMARKGAVVEETGKLQIEIGNLEADLTAKENTFIASVESVKRKLQADVEKFKKLL